MHKPSHLGIYICAAQDTVWCQPQMLPQDDPCTTHCLPRHWWESNGLNPFRQAAKKQRPMGRNMKERHRQGAKESPTPGQIMGGGWEKTSRDWPTGGRPARSKTAKRIHHLLKNKQFKQRTKPCVQRYMSIMHMYKLSHLGIYICAAQHTVWCRPQISNHIALD